MSRPVSRIVIVGGGTAGWLAACLIAARADRSADHALEITLIESPDVPTIGVGEGTWPTMRRTLERIGIGEAEFLLACDASFKQGSRFDGWATGAPGDVYHHPFVPPPAAEARELVAAWAHHSTDSSFAGFVSPQPKACGLGLAPRQRSMPDFAGALNYAYHLDAARFAALLARHATQKLGVRHLRDHVTGVTAADCGDIATVQTREHGSLDGDLFIDCTGHAALLIGGQFGVPFRDCSQQLFNDRALAVQVPVAAETPIASQTIATAHSAGWLWDIGLPERRGVGCVYASSHASDEQAEVALENYLRKAAPEVRLDDLSVRKLSFRSGHRERFWERNCLAVGLSAGFVEPLEASAIVMIELSLDALVENFPVTREVMDAHARRFNALFNHRWERIIEFLKLHYVLSKRPEPFWREHRDAATIPPRLAELLDIWKYQPPSSFDFPAADEVFPAASHQYVLYGMGFPPPPPGPIAPGGSTQLPAALRQVQERARALCAALPTNRAYLQALRADQAPQAAPLESVPVA